MAACLLLTCSTCWSQAKAAGYERHDATGSSNTELQQLAYCASRISRHTAEAKQTSVVTAALAMVQSAADASALAKRLSLCVLGVDVDLWISNWSNLYQLDSMQIGDAKPSLFLGPGLSWAQLLSFCSLTRAAIT